MSVDFCKEIEDGPGEVAQQAQPHLPDRRAHARRAVQGYRRHPHLPDRRAHVCRASQGDRRRAWRSRSTSAGKAHLRDAVSRGGGAE
eukprot:2949179-Heterocapsa_arctica.AAC.1